MPDGYVTAGDCVRKTITGHIKILDRTKDMIQTGSVNVPSLEVERYMARHPAIKDVSVIGLPATGERRGFGEDVVAVVIVKSDAKVTEEELIQFGRHGDQRGTEHKPSVSADRGLEDSFRPKRIIFYSADDFPRNEQGKVLKRQLKEQLND